MLDANLIPNFLKRYLSFNLRTTLVVYLQTLCFTQSEKQYHLCVCACRYSICTLEMQIHLFFKWRHLIVG